MPVPLLLPQNPSLFQAGYRLYFRYSNPAAMVYKPEPQMGRILKHCMGTGFVVSPVLHFWRTDGSSFCVDKSVWQVSMVGGGLSCFWGGQAFPGRQED